MQYIQMFKNNTKWQTNHTMIKNTENIKWMCEFNGENGDW